MWVIFLHLGDVPPDKYQCENFHEGPEQLKYCEDGGVYYAYNFVETGHKSGHVGFPRGFDSLPRLAIDPRVTAPVLFKDGGPA